MGLLRPNPSFIFHAIASLTWLGGLAIFNHQSPEPVMSLFPYLVPVIFFAWSQGAIWGFVFAALATLSALPAGYVESHTQAELIYAGIATYAKLTGVAIGISLARRIYKNGNRA